MTSSDITVLSHADGFLLLSDPATVEAFVTENELESIAPTPVLLGAVGSLLQAASAVAENSGRWVKLTEESAAALAKHGASLSSKSGFMTGVVRFQNGAIAKHLQFEPPTVLNPAAVASLGVMMTQMAQQRQLNEMTNYLREISADVKDLLDDQLHRATADLAGIALTIEEVQTVLQATGRVDEVLWTKLHGASQTLATTQAYALKKLEAAANDLARAKGSSELGDDAEAMTQVRDACTSWLNLLTHSIVLADSLAQLEIERQADAGLERLEDYLRGLQAARVKRTERIAAALEAILSAASDIAQSAQSKRLTRPRRVASITASNNAIRDQLQRFSQAVGIDDLRFDEIENPKFHDYAASRLKDAAASAASRSREVAAEASQLSSRAVEAKDHFVLSQADKVKAKQRTLDAGGSGALEPTE